MISDQEVLKKVGKGMSMNAFFYEFDYPASIILDKLVYSGKLRIERSKKYRMHVVLPVGQYLEENDEEQ